MELVYLICSVVSSTLTSAVLSLRLALRCLASCLCRPPGGDFEAAERGDAPLLRLYQGHVKHVRRSPHYHAFEYPVRYALVNLERACSSTASALPPSLFPPSFFAGHLSPDNARAVTNTNGPVLLLTIPPSVGYEQNPLSIYYCYDVVPRAGSMHTAAGASDGGESMASTRPCLRKCIAEVTNTPWGERVSFVFDPRSDLVAKPLHVSPFMRRGFRDKIILWDAPGWAVLGRKLAGWCSQCLRFPFSLPATRFLLLRGKCMCSFTVKSDGPFYKSDQSGSLTVFRRLEVGFPAPLPPQARRLMGSPTQDMLGNWKMHAGEPGEKLFVGISVQHPEMGSCFTATLSAREVSPSRLGPALFFWMMPQKVALWIYWQAAKLWWKKLSFVQHPRYSNPAYREDALSRDGELRCPLTTAGGEPRDDGRRPGSAAEGGGGTARWCVWRDAEWPWS